MKQVFKLLGEVLSLLMAILMQLNGKSIKVVKRVIKDYDWEESGIKESTETKSSSRYVPWLHTAKNLINTDEVPGSRNNPIIMRWAANVGGWVKSYFKCDSVPWCGLFIDHCYRANGIEAKIKFILRARDWLNFGFKTDPCLGALMIFSRNGGGHVGFYISEDDGYFHILGGNQSDSVNVMRIAKGRFLGARWPFEYRELRERMGGRVWKKFDGTVSLNEQ